MPTTDLEEANFRRALDEYLRTGDATLMADAIRKAPPSEQCSHDHPYCHRICDITLGSDSYRVLRCIKCGERLFVRLLHGQSSLEPGVPYWLSGAKLSQW